MQVQFKNMYIDGGVHLNEKRMQRIKQLIKEIKPSIIAVEYDERRLKRGIYKELKPNDVYCGLEMAKKMEVPVALIDSSYDERTVLDSNLLYKKVREDIYDSLGFEWNNKAHTLSLNETEEVMNEFKRLYPEDHYHLIDKRDKSMSCHLKWISDEFKSAVVLVGATHAPGIYEYLSNDNINKKEPVINIPKCNNTREIENTI